MKELAPHYVPPWAERTPWAWTNPPVLAASTHPPLPLKRLCHNPFMVRQGHHERIMSASKFSHLAVRPEPVEGRPGDYDAVYKEGGLGRAGILNGSHNFP